MQLVEPLILDIARCEFGPAVQIVASTEGASQRIIRARNSNFLSNAGPIGASSQTVLGTTVKCNVTGADAGCDGQALCKDAVFGVTCTCLESYDLSDASEFGDGSTCAQSSRSVIFERTRNVQLTVWKPQETASSFEIVATGTHPITITTNTSPSIPWLSISCDGQLQSIFAPLSPSTSQKNYPCKLDVDGQVLTANAVADGAKFSTAVTLARQCTQSECRLAPQELADMQLNVSITVLSRPSCVKSSVAWPSTWRKTIDATPVFKHDEDLHAIVSAIDVGGLKINYSLAALRWTYEYNGAVSAPEGLVRSESDPSQYSARLLNDASISRPGRYQVTISLDGWDETSHHVRSCVLGSIFTFEIECADGSSIDASGKCSNKAHDLCSKSPAYATFESIRSELTWNSALNDSSVVNVNSSVGDQSLKIRYIPLQGIIEADGSVGQQLSRTGGYDIYLKTSYAECLLVRPPHKRWRGVCTYMRAR
jgi:hypothetical protein